MQQKVKKIVFTVINDLTYDRRMNRICTSLAQNGYEVTLVGRELPTSLPIITQLYHQKRMRCWVNKGAFFYLEYNLRLFFWLLCSRFDLYGAIDLDTILPHKLVSFLKSKPFVYDAHEYFTEVIEIQNRPLIKAVWKRIERLCIGPKTKAYTVSQSYANLFKAHYGADFQVIRNVPPLTPHICIGKHPVFTFVYVGAVNAGRGIEESIKAIEGLDAHLRICGDGDVLEELKQNLPHHQECQVSFTGYLPPNELEQEAQKAHAGLLLLKSESLSYYYSLANKFFDYVHAEVPELVIDFPEYQLMNQEYQVALLSPLKVDEIRRRMLQMMTDSELYERLKNQTKLAKNHWNWQNEEQKLLLFYDSIWQND